MTAALTRLFSSRLGALAVYVVFLGAYLAASGPRLRNHSPYNHFVYLAEGWLHGRLSLHSSPPNENDWAKLDVLALRDGRTVRGMFGRLGAADRFYHSKGGSETITDDEIASRSYERYVTFPPLPSVVMLPFVAIMGLRLNDVLFTVIWGAANPALFFLLLGALRRRGLSDRSLADDLWLCALFGAGTVLFYSSVLGQVWYTAHVIGVTCALGYAFASVDASRPALAGLCMGLGLATRTPLMFAFPFFLFEAARVSGGWADIWGRCRQRQLPKDFFGRLVRFGVPAAALLLLTFAHNYARFGNAMEVGYKYLNISWQDRIARWGLFNYHFLSRNLACALVLMPKIMTAAPFVKVSHHGMSLFFTTPNYAYLAAPKQKSPLALGLWLTVLAVALPSLLYQNSGYIQFGYRFSNDYVVFLMMLLAVGGRRFGRIFRTLVVLAIGVNLFGAITFDRYGQFGYDDSFFPHGFN
jgi:hypothetical protein